MIRSVGVVVPACDEQALITSCINAILEARRYALDCATSAGLELEIRVVVVLDSCQDDTARLVSGYPEVEAVTCSFASVGPSRGLGVQHLLTNATERPEQYWLANTDADSRVPKTWITEMLRHAMDGADLVLGTVEPGEGLRSGVRHLWQQRHATVVNHPHVHGANFGIRASCYSRLGGWPLLATGEDVELAARVTDCRASRVVRTSSIPVVTSARTIGRAPHGFAGYLRLLAGEAAAL